MNMGNKIQKMDLSAEHDLSVQHLFAIIKKHKLAFWITVVLFLAAGIAFVTTAPKQYQFSQIVSVGSILNEKMMTPIEPIKSTIERINLYIIPRVLAKHPVKDSKYLFAADASAPYFKLYGRGALEEEETYKTIFAEIYNILIEEEKIVHSAFRQADMQKLAISKAQLQENKARFSQLTKLKQEMLSGKQTENNKSTFIQIASLILELSHNIQFGYALEMNIVQLEANLKSMKAPQLIESMQVKPVNLNAGIIMTMFLLLGFIAAFFVTLCLEFIRRVFAKADLVGAN